MPRKKRRKTEAQIARELGVGETTAHRYLRAGMPAYAGPARDAWLAANSGRGKVDTELFELRKAKVAAEVLRTKRLSEFIEAKIADMIRRFVRRDAVVRLIDAHVAEVERVLRPLVKQIHKRIVAGGIDPRLAERVRDEVALSINRAIAAVAEAKRTVEDLERIE